MRIAPNELITPSLSVLVSLVDSGAKNIDDKSYPHMDTPLHGSPIS